MRVLRSILGVLLVASAALGTLALVQPASAEPPDLCPQPFLHECEPCPDTEDPVVCMVICAGGPRQMTFRNNCYAACSGYIFKGECPGVVGHP